MKQYKSLPALLRRLDLLYLERKVHEDSAAKLRHEQTQLEKQARELMEKGNVGKTTTPAGGSVTRTTQPTATVNDWSKVLAAVGKHVGDPRWESVVHKRVSASAVEKLSFEGVYVDGLVLAHQETCRYNAPRKKKAPAS